MRGLRNNRPDLYVKARPARHPVDFLTDDIAAVNSGDVIEVEGSDLHRHFFLEGMCVLWF